MAETVTVTITARQALAPGDYRALPRESIDRTFGFRIEAEVRKRISEMSRSMRLPEQPFGG